MQTNETDHTVIRTFKDPEFGLVDWIQYTDDKGHTVYTYKIRMTGSDVVRKLKKMTDKA